MEVKIIGKDKVIANIDKLSKKTLAKAEKVIRDSALTVVAEAKKNISRPYPGGAVDTGTLRSSITYAPQEVSENRVVYVVGSPVHYAPYVEFGTKPHFPPIGDEHHGLMRWVLRHARARKGALPAFKVLKKSRVEEARSIAFAIAKAISRRGLRPRPFLRPALAVGKNRLIQRLVEITK